MGQGQRLVAVLIGLAVICFIDLIISPIILRAAAAAFNGLARMTGHAPPPPKKRDDEEVGTKKKKKSRKASNAYPEPSAGQAILVAFLTIAGTVVPGVVIGALLPALANVTGWKFSIVAIALRIGVESLVLTSVMSADFLRSVGVAVLDVLIRILLITGVMLAASVLMSP